MTDLYYLSFDLSPRSAEFILGILNGVTEDERVDILRSYTLQHRHAITTPGSDNSNRLELPQRGRGLAIGLVFDSVREFILTENLPGITDTFPSFVFLNAAILCYGDDELCNVKDILLKNNFDDDSGLICHEDEARLILIYVTACVGIAEWEEICTIFAMLGIKHPLLKNEHIDHYLPYQIQVPNGGLDRRSWEVMKQEIRDKVAIEESELEAIMEPHLS